MTASDVASQDATEWVQNPFKFVVMQDHQRCNFGHEMLASYPSDRVFSETYAKI